jgi:hypothetical protein
LKLWFVNAHKCACKKPVDANHICLPVASKNPLKDDLTPEEQQWQKVRLARAQINGNEIEI